MSWLARLLGKSSPAPVAPPPTSVVVPQDIADRLTASGVPLGDAVEAALREHLTSLEQAHQRGEVEAPFWLTRDDEAGGDIEDRLRDRIAQRRSGEAEAER
jgi:hypothetical protein